MPIRTKHENNVLYQAGAFGNKLRTWGTLQELKESGYEGSVSVRYLRPGTPFFRYNIPIDQVPFAVNVLESLGADRSLCTFNETAPDAEIVLQGEMWDGEYPFRLRYSSERTSNRHAMERSRHAVGWAAWLLLKEHMTPSSFEDLRALLECYPTSIVEFSIFSCTLGDIPGRNTIIWECRDY